MAFKKNCFTITSTRLHPQVWYCIRVQGDVSSYVLLFIGYAWGSLFASNIWDSLTINSQLIPEWKQTVVKVCMQIKQNKLIMLKFIYLHTSSRLNDNRSFFPSLWQFNITASFKIAPCTFGDTTDLRRGWNYKHKQLQSRCGYRLDSTMVHKLLAQMTFGVVLLQKNSILKD